MQLVRVFLLLALVLGVSACGSSKFRTYHGPEVTSIQVHKADRRMDLLHHERVLRSFPIGLGFAPIGHKTREGDGRTPEGRYYIDRRNGDSRFHLSLGISYPNADDKAYAEAMGVSPGGDIFIHGRGPRFSAARGDWTAGCISVTDRQMEHVYAMVRTGTPIDILP